MRFIIKLHEILEDRTRPLPLFCLSTLLNIVSCWTLPHTSTSGLTYTYMLTSLVTSVTCYQREPYSSDHNDCSAAGSGTELPSSETGGRGGEGVSVRTIADIFYPVRSTN